MRRYRIAFWTILILSIIDFTIAVPVSVRGIHGVRVNMVGVVEDRITALEKRMDNDGGEPDPDDARGESDSSESEEDLGVGGGEQFSDDDGGELPSDVSSEHERPYHGGPQSETGSNTDPLAGSAWDSGSDDDGSVNGGGAAEVVDEEQEEQEEQEDQHQSDEEEDPQSDVEDQGSSDEAEDHEQSHPQSPELQHPAASTYEDLWSKLLKDSLRPRASTSEAATEGVAGN